MVATGEYKGGKKAQDKVLWGGTSSSSPSSTGGRESTALKRKKLEKNPKHQPGGTNDFCGEEGAKPACGPTLGYKLV